MGVALPAIKLGAGRHATALAAGNFHTCALLDEGSVKCWGNNAYCALGFPPEAVIGGSPEQMGDALPAVPLGRKAVEIASGAAAQCALLDDDSVKCWGITETLVPKRASCGDVVSAQPSVPFGT
jgi:E3 ubiquitin-protein ligase HERC3